METFSKFIIIKFQNDTDRIFSDGYISQMIGAGLLTVNEARALDGRAPVEKIEEATFQLVYPTYEDPERYFINSLGEFKYVNVELDKESWDEIFHDFFEAMDNAVTEVTFDELFSDIEHP